MKTSTSVLLLILGTVFCFALVASYSGHNSKKTSSSPQYEEPQETVSNSEWDGSVYEVKRHLKKNLKDPGSFEAIEWSPVIKVEGLPHKYIVRCMYRAKNSFGGYVIENQAFYMDAQGNVLSVRNLE